MYVKIQGTYTAIEEYDPHGGCTLMDELYVYNNGVFVEVETYVLSGEDSPQFPFGREDYLMFCRNHVN